MSFSTELFVEVDVEDEVMRAEKLAAARKKLKTFRASRSSANLSNPSNPSASTSTSTSMSTPALAPLPLTTDIGANYSAPPRSPNKPKSKDLDMQMAAPKSPHKLRKSRSKGSMNTHRRQPSSISISNPHLSAGHSAGLARGSVFALFDNNEEDAKPMRAILPGPSEIITTPATPLLDPPTLEAGSMTEEENIGAVKNRLSSFSFGAKPPAVSAANSRSPSPRARGRTAQQPSLLPSQLVHPDGFTSPSSSPSRRLSTPLSRPPSLLLTRPTPLAFGTPTNSSHAGPSSSRGGTGDSPQTPPTPARVKRHSHTRSNSISLPNLKLTSRPTSLGIPSSPSFPSSPSSPSGSGPSRLSAPIQGTRLKFEPSGRGAEAEKEKDEYRRKALEKLTGSTSPTLRNEQFDDGTGHEIALPDLDDEDTSSIASSSRPFSGAGSFSFGGRPSSSSSSSVPPAFSWSANEDSPPLDRWSGFGHQFDEKDETFGFGFTFGGATNGSFSFNSLPSTTPHSLEAGLGMGLPSTMAKRPSLTRNLSVLAEVDEPEDADEEENEVGPDTDITEDLRSIRPPEQVSAPMSPELTDGEYDKDDQDNNTATYVPIHAPTPSRLRELHLVSSVSSTPSSVPRTIPNPTSYSTPTAPGSPTKGYGAIGRGRPRPLSGISSDLFRTAASSDSPSTAGPLISTPKTVGINRRRAAAPGSGSRGSSISYKKDDSSSSSRDWSMSSIKIPLSPPTSLGEVGSPPALNFSPRFTGWGNVPKSSGNVMSRPCPRPKSLAGLGIDTAASASGRILGEVEEEEEDIPLTGTTHGSDGLKSFAFMQDVETSSSGRDSEEFPTEGTGNGSRNRDSFPAFGWRSPHLELEMERDALREDVEMWKKRYGAIEERLESEKKETGVLRERVRKLGDRLSSVSSYPNPQNTQDASLIADLRNQLFSVTSQLERERSERQSAQNRLNDLQARLANTQVAPPSAAFKPTLPSLALQSLSLRDFDEQMGAHVNVIPPTPLSPEPPCSESPSSTLGNNSPDPNFNRMKSWGFPREPPPGMGNKPRSRESFFGLSQGLRRDSTISSGGEDAIEGEKGVDLPPFVLPQQTHVSATRTVSEPIREKEEGVGQEGAEPRSTSLTLTSSASNALSYFAGYLSKGSTSSPPRQIAKNPSTSSAGSTASAPSSTMPTGTSVLQQSTRHVSSRSGRSLDFRHGCKCCVGRVIEL